MPLLIQVFFNSGRAYWLNRRVGVLMEVPVKLLVVKIVNRSKGWFEAGLSAK